jgi:hypothetical protein
MKKSKTQEIRMAVAKPSKHIEIPKSKLKLKTHIFRRLTLKHNSSSRTHINKTLDCLIFSKNTHLSVGFKDDVMFNFQDEFLKR